MEEGGGKGSLPLPTWEEEGRREGSLPLGFGSTRAGWRDQVVARAQAVPGLDAVATRWSAMRERARERAKAVEVWMVAAEFQRRWRKLNHGDDA